MGSRQHMRYQVQMERNSAARMVHTGDNKVHICRAHDAARV